MLRSSAHYTDDVPEPDHSFSGGIKKGSKMDAPDFSMMTKMKRRGLLNKRFVGYRTRDNLGPDDGTGRLFPVEEGTTSNFILSIPDEMTDVDRSDIVKVGIQKQKEYDHRFTGSTVPDQHGSLHHRLSNILAPRGLDVSDIRSMDDLGKLDPKMRGDILRAMGLIKHRGM
jgi:hypothetical protein